MKFSASCSSLPHSSLAELADSYRIHLVQGSLAGAGTVSSPQGVKKKNNVLESGNVDITQVPRRFLYRTCFRFWRAMPQESSSIRKMLLFNCHLLNVFVNKWQRMYHFWCSLVFWSKTKVTSRCTPISFHGWRDPLRKGLLLLLI